MTSTSVLKRDSGTNVQVVLRCRPPNQQENRQRSPTVITCKESLKEVTLQHSVNKNAQKTYSFDKVFGPNSTQSDIFNLAVQPMVMEVLAGYNCTIFAYGQTGTGKTYTMEGPSCLDDMNQLEEVAGVIPRAIQHIFNELDKLTSSDYTVKVSFIEIYNEELTDLLYNGSEKEKSKLRVMEDKSGVVLQGIDEQLVRNSQEIFDVLQRGSAHRTTAETLQNKQSSRSHSIFTVSVLLREQSKDGEDIIRVGKLTMVDLAGSENITKSGAKDNRAREAASINQSLLTLGRVITALTENSGHIPYRDSKLTRLLRESLGGCTKTCIIATIAPTSLCLEESVNTLDYAHRAKHIRNNPTINQRITKAAVVKELALEMDRLKADLMATREKNGVFLPPERLQMLEVEQQAQATKIKEMEKVLEQQSNEAQDKVKNLEDIIKSQNKQIGEQSKTLSDRQQQINMLNIECMKFRKDIQTRDEILLKKEKYAQELFKHGQYLTTQISDLSIDYDAAVTHVEKYKLESEGHQIAWRELQECMDVQYQVFQQALQNSFQNQVDQLDLVNSDQEKQQNQNKEGVTQFNLKVQSFMKSMEGLQKDLQSNMENIHSSTSQQIGAVVSSVHENLGTMQENLQESVQKNVKCVKKIKEQQQIQKQEQDDCMQFAIDQAQATYITNLSLQQQIGSYNKHLQLTLSANQEEFKRTHGTQKGRLSEYSQSLSKQLSEDQQEIVAFISNVMQSITQQNSEVAGTSIESLVEILQKASQQFYNKLVDIAKSADEQQKHIEDQQGNTQKNLEQILMQYEKFYQELQDTCSVSRTTIGDMKQQLDAQTHNFKMSMDNHTKIQLEGVEQARGSNKAQIEQMIDEPQKYLASKVAQSLTKMHLLGATNFERNVSLSQKQQQEVKQLKQCIVQGFQQSQSSIQGIQGEAVQSLGKRIRLSFDADQIPPLQKYKALPSIGDLQNMAQTYLLAVQQDSQKLQVCYDQATKKQCVALQQNGMGDLLSQNSISNTQLYNSMKGNNNSLQQSLPLLLVQQKVI